MKYPIAAVAAWMANERRQHGERPTTEDRVISEEGRRRKYALIGPDGRRYEGLDIHEAMALVQRVAPRGPWQIATCEAGASEPPADA